MPSLSGSGSKRSHSETEDVQERTAKKVKTEDGTGDHPELAEVTVTAGGKNKKKRKRKGKRSNGLANGVLNEEEGRSTAALTLQEPGETDLENDFKHTSINGHASTSAVASNGVTRAESPDSTYDTSPTRKPLVTAGDDLAVSSSSKIGLNSRRMLNMASQTDPDLPSSDVSHEKAGITSDGVSSTLSKFKDYITSTQQSLTCQICLDLLHKPYTLTPCGHVSCYDCLVSWFSNPNVDVPVNIIAQSKTCPHCRAQICERPTETWIVKDMVANLVKSGLVEGSMPPLDRGKDAPPLPHGTTQADREQDPWAGIFPDADEGHNSSATTGMYDPMDGVWRCWSCHHELWDGVCTSCSRPHLTNPLFGMEGSLMSDEEAEDGVIPLSPFVPGPWMAGSIIDEDEGEEEEEADQWDFRVEESSPPRDIASQHEGSEEEGEGNGEKPEEEGYESSFIDDDGAAEQDRDSPRSVLIDLSEDDGGDDRVQGDSGTYSEPEEDEEGDEIAPPIAPTRRRKGAVVLSDDEDSSDSDTDSQSESEEQVQVFAGDGASYTQGTATSGMSMYGAGEDHVDDKEGLSDGDKRPLRPGPWLDIDDLKDEYIHGPEYDDDGTILKRMNDRVREAMFGSQEIPRGAEKLESDGEDEDEDEDEENDENDSPSQTEVAEDGSINRLPRRLFPNGIPDEQSSSSESGEKEQEPAQKKANSGGIASRLVRSFTGSAGPSNSGSQASKAASCWDSSDDDLPVETTKRRNIRFKKKGNRS